MKQILTIIIAIFLIFTSTSSFAQKKSKKSLKKETISLEKTSLQGLRFRSIGPAVTGGRVIDIEVNPVDHSEYYVASGHGNLWKTVNNGITFSPTFARRLL